jgi:membrane AbrB-like protein
MEAPAPLGHQSAAEPLARLPGFAQWALVLSLSALFFFIIELVGMPAAGLIGPMIAGVVAGTHGATIRVPRHVFAIAQGIIGVLIAGTIQPEILATIVADWPLFLAFTLSTLAASSYLGWQISRWRILPGSTAIWGAAPGAASVMVIMADAFGADFRLVAFMQYLRVMMVAAVAAITAAFLVPDAGHAVEVDFLPALRPVDFGLTLAVICIGAALGALLRLPSPYFMGVLILSLVLHFWAGLSFQLPPWLLLIGYACIGLSIGLNFTRPIVRHAARALPQVLGSIALLLGFCAGIGYVLSRTLGIDFLTAYLATSPGGMDSIAIIASASENVDMSFILAMQMARFLIVMIFGPVIARFLAKTAPE